MIETLNQLKEEQLAQVKALWEACKKHDGNAPNCYWHIVKKERTFPVNLLYYDNNQLRGFLSLFFFYKNASEVSVFIHPDYRKRGIARQLIHIALPIAQAQLNQNLIFSCPHHLNDDWLQKKSYHYTHSEYHMVRNSSQPVLTPNPSLKFHQATSEDTQVICALDECCFPHGQVEMASRINNLLTDRNYTIFIVTQNGKSLGKAHIHWQEKTATFTDIAVFPDVQGQGLGTALLAYCINHCLTEGRTRIDLDVETSNQNALNLYIRQGFSIENAVDYWEVPIKTP